MTEFGLNDVHQELLNQYMLFARYERSHKVKSVQQLFQDVIETRLLEATYTADEVKKLLETLMDVVCGEVETELMLFAHNNILLLQQLCTQSEKWHLRLNADLSELHNQDMLLKVKNWEEDFSKIGSSRKAERLVPVVSEVQEATILLRQQFDALQKENEELRKNISGLQCTIQDAQQERDQLSRSLSDCQKELERSQDLMKEEVRTDDSAQWQEVETRFSQLTTSLQESTTSREQAEHQLNVTKENLKQVQAQLQLAQLELERKFSETAAYSNMKKMISKKNDQMKELRRRLQKYQGETDDMTDAGDGDGDEDGELKDEPAAGDQQ